MAGADQAKQQQPPLPQQQQQHENEVVQLQVFLQCFEVTFFYEHYLMALRAQAFSRDKKCEQAEGYPSNAATQLMLLQQTPAVMWYLLYLQKLGHALPMASSHGSISAQGFCT
jgi:hypothetical protein